VENRGAAASAGAAAVIARPSLGRDAIAYLAGTGIYALCQWLLVVVYARVAGPEGVGLFAVATAISAPLIVLSQMSMRQVMIADVAQRFRFEDYLNKRWALSCLAVGAVGLVALAFGYRTLSLLVILAFAIGRALESVSDIFYARAQARGGLGRVSGYIAFRGVATLAGSGGVMAATGSMALSAVAFALTSLVCQLLVRHVENRLFLTATCPRPQSSSWELLLHASPLAVSLFLVSLAAYAPRLVMQQLGGERLAGQASAVEYLLSIGLLGVAALGQAGSAPLAHAYHGGDRRGFVRLAALIATAAGALGVAMTGAAFIFGRSAILALYGEPFEQAASAAAAIMAGGAVGYVASALGYAVSSTGRYARMIIWSVVVLAVTVAGSYLAVSRWGLAGLGIALAVAGATNILAYVHLLARALRDDRDTMADGAGQRRAFDG